MLVQFQLDTAEVVLRYAKNGWPTCSEMLAKLIQNIGEIASAYFAKFVSALGQTGLR
jgi:hypothetical protein